MDGMVTGENPDCLATIRGNACMRMDNASRAKCSQRSGCIDCPKFLKGFTTERSMERNTRWSIPHDALCAMDAKEYPLDAVCPNGSQPSLVALLQANRWRSRIGN